MRKTLLIACCLLSADAYGQTNTFPYPSAGNVGIGVTSPAAKFSVSNFGSELVGSSASSLFRVSSQAIGDNAGAEVSLGSFGFQGSYPNNVSLGIRGFRHNSGSTYTNTGIVIGLDVDNTVREGGFITLRQGGNVGIGALNPRVRLDVSGKAIIQNTLSTNDYTNVAQHNGQIRILNGLGSFGSRALEIALMDDGKGVIQANEAGVGYNTLLLNPASGNVAIGMVSPPAGYKLAVAGNIIAESVVVKLQSTWPDYVFKPQYNLRSLAEVRSYISHNQHLPDMPTDEEIARDGINIGEINAKLLKKVEELTLYLLEKDQQIVEQQKKTDQQEVRIALLEKMLLNVKGKKN